MGDSCGDQRATAQVYDASKLLIFLAPPPNRYFMHAVTLNHGG